MARVHQPNWFQERRRGEKKLVPLFCSGRENYYEALVLIFPSAIPRVSRKRRAFSLHIVKCCFSFQMMSDEGRCDGSIRAGGRSKRSLDYFIESAKNRIIQWSDQRGDSSSNKPEHEGSFDVLARAKRSVRFVVRKEDEDDEKTRRERRSPQYDPRGGGGGGGSSHPRSPKRQGNGESFKTIARMMSLSGDDNNRR